MSASDVVSGRVVGTFHNPVVEGYTPLPSDTADALLLQGASDTALRLLDNCGDLECLALHLIKSDTALDWLVNSVSPLTRPNQQMRLDTALVSKISNCYQVERIAVRVASTMPSIPNMLVLSRTVEGAPIPAINAPAVKSPRGRSLKCVWCTLGEHRT